MHPYKQHPSPLYSCRGRLSDPTLPTSVQVCRLHTPPSCRCVGSTSLTCPLPQNVEDTTENGNLLRLTPPVPLSFSIPFFYQKAFQEVVPLPSNINRCTAGPRCKQMAHVSNLDTVYTLQQRHRQTPSDSQRQTRARSKPQGKPHLTATSMLHQKIWWPTAHTL